MEARVGQSPDFEGLHGPEEETGSHRGAGAVHLAGPLHEQLGVAVLELAVEALHLERDGTGSEDLHVATDL